jgi:hypothetical protein
MRHYIGTFLLGAALLTPLVGKAADDEHHDRDRDHRYYDRSSRDWHAWNDREDQAYRRYLQERHRDYREFSRMKRRDRDDYWKWRHQHPE